MKEYLKTCESCRAFVRNDKKSAAGHCRRHAPLPIMVGQNQKPHPLIPQRVIIEPIIQGCWTPTSESNWCLDWQQDDASSVPLKEIAEFENVIPISEVAQ